MEMFYTIQGEGLHSGTPAFFIRLAGCDVGCVWCDVKESWKVEANQYLAVETIVDQAKLHPARTVVITGGEPLMYDLSKLIKLLHTGRFKVHIETSGAYKLSGNPDWVCVSPKKFKSPLKEVLEKADELKVVVFNTSDFKWAESNAALVNSKCELFLQPEFDKSTELLPAIVDYVKQHPLWRISLQTHKFIGIP
jgi:7-carboxy-7-deazaguanine synthase